MNEVQGQEGPDDDDEDMGSEEEGELSEEEGELSGEEEEEETSEGAKVMTPIIMSEEQPPGMVHIYRSVTIVASLAT